MREITDHKLNGLNDALYVDAMDAPGAGGANHKYRILGLMGPAGVDETPFCELEIVFQNGPISTSADFNGITNEALLAVLIDRARGFNEGPFRCRENAVALTKLEEAMMWLQKRTRDRLARGVEGTHSK